jgi:hypothetical protein
LSGRGLSKSLKEDDDGIMEKCVKVKIIVLALKGSDTLK